jgi:hypothetical protein
MIRPVLLADFSCPLSAWSYSRLPQERPTLLWAFCNEDSHLLAATPKPIGYWNGEREKAFRDNIVQLSRTQR